MKNKIKLLVMALIASAISVVSVSEASANCTAEDPCGTWAMIDNQGTVTNVIVCQTSVCGSGTWAGQTVVPQVAPNSVTHDTTNQGSFIGNADSGSTVTYSNGTFSINENILVSSSEIENTDGATIISTVSIPVSSRSFKYEDTINKNYSEIEPKIETVSLDQASTFKVEKHTEETLDSASVDFYGKKTEEQIINIVVQEQIQLLTAKIQSLIRMLNRIKYFG